MARLLLTCGVAGAGKSTYARALEADGWTRFSIDADAWGQGYTEAAAIPAALALDIRRRQRAEITAALAEGHDVVVDYSFWSRRQRDDYRALGRTHGATVEVVFFDTPEPVLRRRLATRQGRHADDFVVGDRLLHDYLAGFQAPGPDEDDVRRVTTDAAGVGRVRGSEDDARQPLCEPGWEGARNAADLGGLPLVGGGTTAHGRVWRSAAPEWMSSTGWAAARDDGLTRVIDLRNDAERGRRPEHPAVDPQTIADLTVVHAPTEDPEDPAFLEECGPWLDHPRSWGPNLRRYPEKLAHVFTAVASAEGPVLIHCAGGRDRTGMVCSMLLALNGVEPEAIATNYEHGFRGAGAHRGHGLAWDADDGAWTDAADVSPWSTAELDDAMADRIPSLRRWLAETDVAAHLRGAGVSAADLAHLRSALRPPDERIDRD